MVFYQYNMQVVFQLVTFLKLNITHQSYPSWLLFSMTLVTRKSDPDH